MAELQDMSKTPPDSESNGAAPTKTDSNEKSKLVPHEPSQIDPDCQDRLHKSILIVSWISVILVGCLGVTTLVYAIRDESSASFAFSLDAFLDVLSSLVVIWRFTGEDGGLFSKRKETIACLVLGILFLISAVTICTRSVYSLVTNLFPVVEDVMFIIFAVNGTACTLLMLAKIYLGVKLESKSILTDAVNSFIGALLAFSSIIGDVVYEHDPISGWIIDPSMGIACSVLLLAYGIWIMVLSATEFKEVKRDIASQPKPT